MHCFHFGLVLFPELKKKLLKITQIHDPFIFADFKYDTLSIVKWNIEYKKINILFQIQSSIVKPSVINVYCTNSVVISLKIHKNRLHMFLDYVDHWKFTELITEITLCIELISISFNWLHLMCYNMRHKTSTVSIINK